MNQENIEKTIKTPKKIYEKPVIEKINTKKAFVYLGPNIPGGVLQKGSVFKEIPNYLDSIFKRLPEVKDLFIEIKEISEFKKKVQQNGTEENRLYKSVQLETGKGFK